MLRECVRHESLANFILNDKCFYDFFVYVELSTFDIASDAFSSFKVGQNLLMIFEDCGRFKKYISLPV
jgi:hypothetical protein